MRATFQTTIAQKAALFVSIVGCFALFVSTDEALAADVHNCNGVYTDRPCDQVEKAEAGSLSTTSRAPATTGSSAANSIETGKKRSAIHTLRTRLSKERRRLGIELDISEAEDVCEAPTTSLAECRQVVSKFDQRIEERVVARLNQDSQDENSKKSDELTEETNDDDTVIVVQNYPNYRHRRRHWDHNYPRPPHGGHPPHVGHPPHGGRPPHRPPPDYDRPQPPPQHAPPLRRPSRPGRSGYLSPGRD